MAKAVIAGLVGTLRVVASDLDALQVPWALVGGLAVSARANPRTTRDIDAAVGVVDDAQAEQVVHALRKRGYTVRTVLEQARTRRLATVRLDSPVLSDLPVIVDLLFASSGIERETALDAERLRILPRLRLPVARVPHLVVMKLLARNDRTRPQDADDLRALLAEADAEQVAEIRRLARLVEERGFHRGRRLLPALARALREAKPPRSRP